MTELSKYDAVSGEPIITTIEFDSDLTEGLLLKPVVNLSRAASDFVANSR